LSQVFSNLLNNACKYTESGGQISLTAERHGDDVVVTVADTGVGIPAEMLPKIFDLFTQVDRSLERSQGGLGIGLTLVKRLVEMHGGSVQAQSQGSGKGSKFIVRLPTVVEQRRIDGPAHVESKPAGRKVLVVDDNRDSAITLAMLLKLQGHETETVFDGVAAVEAAARFSPDVILLDIGLPKLNGYEAARQIRQLPRGRDVLLVALTGWGQEDDRRKSHEAGFDHHLVKPIEHAALSKLLNEHSANGKKPIVEKSVQATK
jgi:CheY-like chemotaxis protein/anti-sigma regulatory factor (Ser/Thr protein kinase)